MSLHHQLGALSAFLLSTSSAFANNEAAVSTARELAKEGLSAYDAGAYTEANEKLSRALEVVGVPTLALYTARANLKMGKLVRASELYLLATRLDPKGPSESVQIQAQRDAAKERTELLPRIPRLTITLQGEDLEGVEVTLDGQTVPKALLGTPQLVDPGHRKVAAKRTDEEAAAEVDIAEQEHKTATIRFMPRDEAAAGTVPTVETATDRLESPLSTATGTSATTTGHGSKLRTLGWIGISVGGAGLAFGVITGGLALAKRSSLRGSGCTDDNSCYRDQEPDVDSFNSLRTMSSIGFIAGGVLAAAGVTLLLTSPRSEQPRTALVLSPAGASIVGRF